MSSLRKSKSSIKNDSQSESKLQSRNESENEYISDTKSDTTLISRTLSRCKSILRIGSKRKSEPESDPEPEVEIEEEPQIKVKSTDEHQNWWRESVTEYAFNLPLVRANLDRLIGTDIVRLNDHKFMMNLRRKVWNDFDDKLTKKIEEREALDLGADHTDYPMTEDRGNRWEDGPVFRLNKSTNIAVRARRLKIKSIRKRNFEYLMRQLIKEGNAVKLEYDQLRAIQEQIKRIENDMMEKKTKKSKYLDFITKIVNKIKSLLKTESDSKKSKSLKTKSSTNIGAANLEDVKSTRSEPILGKKALKKASSMESKKGKSDSKDTKSKSVSKESKTKLKELKKSTSTGSGTMKESQSKVSFGKKLKSS